MPVPLKDAVAVVRVILLAVALNDRLPILPANEALTLLLRKSPDKVAEVSVLTRRQEHADALNTHGLRVSGRSTVQARVTASCDPEEIPPFDLGIVATKATGLEEAAATLAGHVQIGDGASVGAGGIT